MPSSTTAMFPQVALSTNLGVNHLFVRPSLARSARLMDDFASGCSVVPASIPRPARRDCIAPSQESLSNDREVDVIDQLLGNLWTIFNMDYLSTCDKHDIVPSM